MGTFKNELLSGLLDELPTVALSKNITEVFGLEAPGFTLTIPDLKFTLFSIITIPSISIIPDLLFQNYDNWLTTSRISSLEACVGFVKQFNSVDKIIVGISSPSHLDGICKALSRNAVIVNPSNIQSDDINLINPAKWPL